MATSIDYFKTHPLRISKNLRDRTLYTMRSAEKHYTAPIGDIHPTAGAFIHYGGVELADKITILKPDISDEDLQAMTQYWNKSCGVVCRHLLFYVWRIIAKEQRHGNAGMCAKAFGPAYENNPYYHLVSKINKGGDYLQKIDDCGGLHIGPYVDAVEQHFRKGGWGSAYGGPRWADIAKQLQLYLDGKASAMLAADRCWTLVHNTGPIFNKGFFFQHHDKHLIKVLNAQAKTSVFTMGEDFLNNYEHATIGCFNSFKYLAVKAIQTVEPGYTPGDHNVSLSDGTATTNTPTKGTKKKIGPVQFYSSKDRIAS